jgi:hypothetical protein
MPRRIWRMTGILIANCTANHKRTLSLPSVCAVILLRFGSSGTRARFLYANAPPRQGEPNGDNECVNLVSGLSFRP